MQPHPSDELAVALQPPPPPLSEAHQFSGPFDMPSGGGGAALFIPTDQQQHQQQQHLPQDEDYHTRMTTTTGRTTTTTHNATTTTTTTTNKVSTVSHSTVEKQRRDRINALIDELRDLVPPQSPSQQQQPSAAAAAQLADASVRRPKHAVLADTIALVRDLRNQLATVHLQAQLPPPSTTTAGIKTKQQESRAPEVVAAEAAAAVAAAAAAAAPLSSSAPGPEGVEVAPGDDCLYVKVHCKDRHGLLSDIVRTLKAIPLEIAAAAISTTAAGNVYDVFQVRIAAPGTPKASVDQIKDSVEAAMASCGTPKRRRKSSTR